MREEVHPTSRAYPWMVLSVTSLGVMLVMLNLGTLNVALPVVVHHFHAGAGVGSWILLSYMLVNTVLILVFGQFADIFGRRKLYLTGMAVFTAVSLLIGFSPNVWVLILLRALQAAGGALVITNTTALITDAFPERHLGKGLGVNVLVASAAQLLGPVIGGFLASTLDWRWIFWFNVPFGALGLVWGMIILRALPTRTSGEKVDLAGGGLVFVALGGLIVAATQLGAAGKVGPVVWAGLAAFVLAAGAFLWTERRSASPMIDFGLFRDRAFALAYVATFLNSFARSAVVLLTALFLQVTQQENAFHAGLKVVPVTVGMLLASPVAGALTGRYPVRSLASAGLVGVAVGLVILLLAMTPGAPYGWVGCGLFLVGFGSGFFLTPNTTAIMTAVPPYRRGMANGLRSMLNNMGQVLSAALMLMVVTMPLPPRLKDAVYLGAAAQVSGSDIAEIAGGFRLAFGVLILVTLGALVASVLRGPSARSELGGHPDRDVRVEAGR